MKSTGSTQHFLDIGQIDPGALRTMIEDARTTKRKLQAGEGGKPLAGKFLAMIFDKPSTRTRVSFDVGMRQLGGETILISGQDSQLGRGETIADTARVLSRYVDAIMIRTTEHDRLLELAEHASVPVINGLTDDSHPCQIMTDVLTIEEHCGDIAQQLVAWLGDGNNMVNSLMEAAHAFNFKLNIATPSDHAPDAIRLKAAQSAGASISLHHDPLEAIDNSDCVMTDTWVSMGDDELGKGHNQFQPFQVNTDLMARAKPQAVFMHCLPAHRGEEVTDDVIDGPQSIVFDQAENRLHMQKAILKWCLGVK